MERNVDRVVNVYASKFVRVAVTTKTESNDSSNNDQDTQCTE